MQGADPDTCRDEGWRCSWTSSIPCSPEWHENQMQRQIDQRREEKDVNHYYYTVKGYTLGAVIFGLFSTYGGSSVARKQLTEPIRRLLKQG